MSFLKSLFKERGIKEVITLFHSAQSPASQRVHALLKREHAVPATTSGAREFELDVQEGAPTGDQLNSILEYLGPNQANTVVSEAEGPADALRKFNASNAAFQRPVTVDWNRGRAVVGDNESEILSMLRALPEK